MLSAILSPAEGKAVDQHPDIIRLLKWVFNTRPPERRLVPEWDLRKVLVLLTSKLFEPISKVSLKHLTLKCFPCSNIDVSTLQRPQSIED